MIQSVGEDVEQFFVLIVLIYILLMTDGDDYLFICFLSTGLSYCSEVSAFPSQPHFLDHFLEPPSAGELQM